jgi:ATP-binding cassette subfamily B protein
MDIFNRDPKTRKRFLILKLLFIASGLLQGLSIAFTIPLFKDLFLGNYNRMWLWTFIVGITALSCFIFRFMATNIGNSMAIWEVCDNQIHRIGSAITKLPLGWFDASSKGKISKAISTDINTLSHYPSIVLPEILTLISASLVIGIALTLISWKIGVVTLIMGIFLKYFWELNLRSLDKIEKEIAKANQKMESTIVEFAQLQPVLRAAGALVGGWDRLDKSLEDDKKGSLTFLKSQSSTSSKYMAVAHIGSLLILIIAAIELSSGNIEIYTFIGITIAMISFSNPLAGLLPYGSEIYKSLSALNRIDSIVNAEKLSKSKNPVKIQRDVKNDCKTSGYEIEFKNVNFSYVEGIQVLKNINISIPPGSMTALVGPSGSGKSTVNRLIARFWDVDSGSILINGEDVRNIDPEDLMGAISMVFQEVYLFNTTIKENIAMAKPNATMAEIESAAKRARLDEVIDRLPNGWNTTVGEGGSSLSGGEQQRVSIARAFLKDSPILLLDEITSALDGTNEAIITKSLEELAKNRTVVVIAHRLSSIKRADAIVVIDKGEITGYGTHDELLKENHRYSELWKALIASEEWHV